MVKPCSSVLLWGKLVISFFFLEVAITAGKKDVCTEELTFRKFGNQTCKLPICSGRTAAIDIYGGMLVACFPFCFTRENSKVLSAVQGVSQTFVTDQSIWSHPTMLSFLPVTRRGKCGRSAKKSLYVQLFQWKTALHWFIFRFSFPAWRQKVFSSDCTGPSESKTLNHRINSPAFSLHQPTSIIVGLNSFLKFLS